VKIRSDICTPQRRQAVLAERRRLKMACFAHAYVRGSTLKFYEWLESSIGRSLPEGPPVWICGDCHLGNLGPVADAKGRVKIAIRDLDQAVIGNPTHDLIRLGLSLATAIRGSDLPGVITALMLEHMIEGYEGALANPGNNSKKSAAPASVHRVLKRALKRRWRHLAEERIEDVKPQISHGLRPVERHSSRATTERRAFCCGSGSGKRAILFVRSCPFRIPGTLPAVRAGRGAEAMSKGFQILRLSRPPKVKRRSCRN
jgi:uncharacterized protein (DUF2252 family)